MDFLNRQPHPETDESACTHYTAGAAPLKPVIEAEALACAGAYINGQYHLLVIPADAPELAEHYIGASPDCFQKDELVIRLAAPIRSISFLLQPETPLLCVYADKVYFFNLNGVCKAVLPFDGRSATACWYHGTALLVTEEKIYRLTDQLTLSNREPYPVRAMPCRVDNRTDMLWQTRRDDPGTRGGSVFCWNGRAFYVCCDSFGRCARENLDTFICEIYGLERPFSRRYLAIPNGGEACLFVGKEEKIYAAFVGKTPSSCVYKKAAVLPMDMASGQFLRPSGNAFLESTPSAQLTKIQGVDLLRDSFLFSAPDGWYYLTGTSLGSGRSHLAGTSAIRLWRSKDLKTFEPLGVVYDYRHTPSSWQNHISRDLNSWAPEMAFHAGTYWITYSTSPGCGLLKSVSGKPEGPYQDMGRVVHRGIDSGFFQDGDTLYLIWQNGWIAPLSDDGREMLKEPVLLLPRDGQEVGYEGVGLIKVKGKYILYASEWNGDFRIDGSYDMMYSVADHILGPYSPRRCLVPHGGHSCLFYDHNGILRYTIFGNDRTAPFRRGLGIGRVAVQEEDGVLTLQIAEELDQL